MWLQVLGTLKGLPPSRDPRADCRAAEALIYAAANELLQLHAPEQTTWSASAAVAASRVVCVTIAMLSSIWCPLCCYR